VENDDFIVDNSHSGIHCEF